MKTPFLAIGKAVVIRCERCGWSMRVAPGDAGPQALYHRDITCTARLVPSVRPHASGSRTRKTGAHKPTARRVCPTCRGPLQRLRDALACTAGCTNEARM